VEYPGDQKPLGCYNPEMFRIVSVTSGLKKKFISYEFIAITREKWKLVIIH